MKSSYSCFSEETFFFPRGPIILPLPYKWNPLCEYSFGEYIFHIFKNFEIKEDAY